jgi:hypothetical protein
MAEDSSTVRIKKPYYYLAIVLIAILIMIVFASARQSAKVAMSKPAMPVTVQERKALLGPGKVVLITNVSNSELSVLATFTSTATHATTSKQLVIEPHKVAEIGYAQGWAFASGDMIRLSNISYGDAQYVIR